MQRVEYFAANRCTLVKRWDGTYLLSAHEFYYSRQGPVSLDYAYLIDHNDRVFLLRENPVYSPLGTSLLWVKRSAIKPVPLDGTDASVDYFNATPWRSRYGFAFRGMTWERFSWVPMYKAEFLLRHKLPIGYFSRSGVAIPASQFDGQMIQMAEQEAQFQGTGTEIFLGTDPAYPELSIPHKPLRLLTSHPKIRGKGYPVSVEAIAELSR